MGVSKPEPNQVLNWLGLSGLAQISLIQFGLSHPKSISSLNWTAKPVLNGFMVRFRLEPGCCWFLLPTTTFYVSWLLSSYVWFDNYKCTHISHNTLHLPFELQMHGMLEGYVGWIDSPYRFGVSVLITNSFYISSPIGRYYLLS